MILFAGSLCNNIYTESILHSPLQPISREQIQKLEATFQVSIIVLAGRHYNECIYAVITPSSSDVDLDGIAKNIYSLHNNNEEPLNLVISNTCSAVYLNPMRASHRVSILNQSLLLILHQRQNN